MERKDSIRRFLREQFKSDDKKKDKEHKDKESKETKESKENKENIAAASSSTAAAGTAAAAAAAANSVAAATESVKSSATDTKTKSSAYRLFRTVCMHLKCILFHFNSFASVCAPAYVCLWFCARLLFGLHFKCVCRGSNHIPSALSVRRRVVVGWEKCLFCGHHKICWILLLCSPTNR